jgi:uncharacterized protein YfiM (DUF2279 family)
MIHPVKPGHQLLPRNLRMFAVLAVVLTGTGLHVLGAQAFAVGLFHSPWDKLAHVMTFAFLGGAIGLASGTRGWRQAFFCIGGALVMGVMDEWHQAYLPGRVASWSDLLADVAGGVLAATLLGMWQGATHWRDRYR